jgi:hypothetical protein
MPEPTPPPSPVPPDQDPFSREYWKRWVRLNLPQFITWAIALAVWFAMRDGKGPAPIPPTPIWGPPDTGWVPPHEEDIANTLASLKVSRFRLTEAGQAVVAEGDAPLWRLAEKGRGGKKIPTRDQGAVGSCVGVNATSAGEYTLAAQVGLAAFRQDAPDLSAEVTYAGSRVEANGGRVPFRGDGSTGAWAAKWIDQLGGYLPRKVYGTHDLTEYSVQRAKQWGDSGVPDDLEPLARKHRASCTLVETVDEARKALSQGYAIFVCSNVGFQSNAGRDGKPTRDAQGFLKAQGNWAHCMTVIGYRADRAGFLILNSWGANWVSGPKGFGDEPDGAFWCDSATFARILKEQDSYAVANADGFRRRKIEPADWLIRGNAPHERRWNDAFALAP